MFDLSLSRSWTRGILKIGIGKCLAFFHRHILIQDLCGTFSTAPNIPEHYVYVMSGNMTKLFLTKFTIHGTLSLSIGYACSVKLY